MGILRKIFGPSTREIWTEVSAEGGYEFVKGSLLTGDQVVGRYRDWTVTLDTYSVRYHKSTTVYTRMRANFYQNDCFCFKIFRHGLLGDVGKQMGMQDMEVGYPDLDKNFTIMGSDLEKLKRLFANNEFRELLGLQQEVYFEVRESGNPPGTHQLFFQVVGVIRDKKRLHSLFSLFAQTLDLLSP